jgi:predicted esterase
VGLLSGFVPRGAESLTSVRPLAGVRVFVAHGSADELVSIEHARQSVGLLEAAGATVTVCEDDVGHKVSAGCARALQAFLLG